MREFREPEGRWRLCAARAELLVPALELARRQRAALTQASAPAELAGTRAWYEHERLRGGERWRLALGSLALRPLPRVRQYANLEWLRARSFLAPRPLAAGCLLRAGLPAYAFLLCERIEAAETLARFLERADEPLRAAVLEELARETARLHCLHGARRELRLRDMLVQRGGSAGRVFFLDGSSGGPSRLLEDPQTRLAPAERERFRASYAEERAAQSAT